MTDRRVRGFFSGARRDPLIGPIFEREVRDWEAYFVRMRDFWPSVALMSGCCHGQPMAAHLPLPIDTPLFDCWLGLFAAAGARFARQPLPSTLSNEPIGSLSV
jgi:hemoglobin